MKKIFLFGLIAMFISNNFIMAKEEQPIMGNADLIIPLKKIPKLEYKALKGDADAANQLSNYYGMVLLNDKEETYWRNIAAENGDPVAQYNYGASLLDETTAAILADDNPKVIKQLNLRGKFWLKQAAKQGDTSAIGLLNELDENRVKLIKNLGQFLMIPPSVILKKQWPSPESDIYTFTTSNDKIFMKASVDYDPTFPQYAFLKYRKKLKVKDIKINGFNAKQVSWHQSSKLTSGEVIFEIKGKSQYIHFYYNDLNAELADLVHKIIFSTRVEQ